MLSQYREMNVPEYLDGRYFGKVMKSLDPFAVVHMPLKIRINEQGKVFENTEVFANNFAYTAETMYARIILEKAMNGAVTMRHSQLLIITRDKVIHFEPDQTVYEDVELYDGVIGIISELFSDHEIKRKVLSKNGVHGHHKVNGMMRVPGGFCLAYVLKYAYFHALGEKVTIGDHEDIHKFSRAVELLYGPLTKGSPDIEFGPGTGTVVGGLGGAGVGLLVGGPVGALVGGAGGALIGSQVGRRGTTVTEERVYRGNGNGRQVTRVEERAGNGRVVRTREDYRY